MIGYKDFKRLQIKLNTDYIVKNEGRSSVDLRFVSDFNKRLKRRYNVIEHNYLSSN